MNDEQVPTDPAQPTSVEPGAPIPPHPFARPAGAGDAEPAAVETPVVAPASDPFTPTSGEPVPTAIDEQPTAVATDPLAPAASDPFAPTASDPFGPASSEPFAHPSGEATPYAPVGWAPGETVGAPVAAPRKRRAGLIVPLAVVLGLLAGIVGGAVGYGIADRQSSTLTDGSATLGAVDSGSSARPDGSIAGIAARVLPTVVSISTRTATEGGTGSGFVIDGNGYVLTNNHVIDSAATGNGSITVTYSDGKSEPARVVGRDTSYDLAVLKVGRKGLSVAQLGNSDSAVVGDSVVAVGSPLGLQGTVTSGIVSAKDRPVTTSGDGSSQESFINAIQTDASINPGNSGGPLVDRSAAVIGVNSAIASLGATSGQGGSIGVGFAIPINQARRVAEEIIRTGQSTRPVIGASVDSTYSGPGARIASQSTSGGAPPVTPGGPADKAGIKPGDIVLSVDGRAVNGAAELIVAIRSNAPGDTVTLRVRNPSGQERTVKVTLGSQKGT